MIQIPHRLFIKSILKDVLIPWQVTRAVFLAGIIGFSIARRIAGGRLPWGCDDAGALSAGHIEIAHRHAEFGRI